MPKRLVLNSDERTNLTPEERRQARKRSYRLLREILRRIDCPWRFRWRR